MTEIVHAPAELDKEGLIRLLQDVYFGVLTGDSLEGFIEYTIGDAPGMFDVRARYRVGNREGQGGHRMVGEFVPKES